MNKNLILGICIFILQSCSSQTVKEKVYRNMLIASVIGIVAADKKEDHKLSYALAYSGALSSLAAIGSLEYYDSDQERRELKAQLKFINDFESQKSKSISESLPEDLKNLVNSYEYDVYRINRWTQRGPNLIVKESEVIELKKEKTNEE